MAEPENEEGLVWKKRSNQAKFLVGRNGDMLLSPFQCDLCWFGNILKRDPVRGELADDNLMAYIRRVNLDMLWGSQPYTVASTKRIFLKGLRMCSDLSVPPTYPELGSWPIGDDVGFTVALQLL